MYGDVNKRPSGIPEDRLKVIGVELTYIAVDGQREEVKMFSADDLTLPDPRSGYFRGQLQVTIHTSNGDRQAQIQL